MNDILKKVGLFGIVPVVKIENADDAEPLAKALIAGGLPLAEITFRTDAAAESIARITKAYPDMLIGAGTVLAGVIEPASAMPVVIEDNVFIGANAVVIEGVHVGKNAVVAAGSVVISDVPDKSAIAAFMQACPIRVLPDESDVVFAITLTLRAGADTVRLSIADYHTHIVRIERNGETLLEDGKASGAGESSGLTDRSVLSVAVIRLVD